MVLLPKEFNISVSKVDARLRALTSSNYDGISKDPSNNFAVSWKVEPSNADLAIVENFWNALTEQTYNTPTSAEQASMLAARLDAAMQFGKALVVEVAMFNIMLGITQAGKTRAVADYCQKLQYYLTTGSLYAAIEELTAMRNDITRPLLGLSPYITDARLDEYKAKIQAFLGQ